MEVKMITMTDQSQLTNKTGKRLKRFLWIFAMEPPYGVQSGAGEWPQKKQKAEDHPFIETARCFNLSMTMQLHFYPMLQMSESCTYVTISLTAKGYSGEIGTILLSFFLFRNRVIMVFSFISWFFVRS